MRPITLGPLTPAAADAKGFADDVTGASWPLTATSAGDNLAHKVTILNNAVTDHSAKTALLTGTDADGNAQTETLALPNGNTTVTSTKYFKTLTSVVPSATVGADTMDIGWSAVAISQTIALDRLSAATANMAVDVTGTVNFSVQETMGNVLATVPAGLPWVAITALATKTALTQGSATLGAAGVRLLVNSVTAGATITAYVSQPALYVC